MKQYQPKIHGFRITVQLSEEKGNPIHALTIVDLSGRQGDSFVVYMSNDERRSLIHALSGNDALRSN